MEKQWKLDCVILASRQTYRSMEQNREHKNNPIHLWSIDFYKVTKTIRCERTAFSTNIAVAPGYPRAEELSQVPFLIPYAYAQSLSCVQLWGPTDCSSPGSSVHGICQARILEWVAISSAQRIFPTQLSNLCLLGLFHWQVGSLPLAPPGKPKDFLYLCKN